MHIKIQLAKEQGQKRVKEILCQGKECFMCRNYGGNTMWGRISPSFEGMS